MEVNNDGQSSTNTEMINSLNFLKRKHNETTDSRPTINATTEEINSEIEAFATHYQGSDDIVNVYNIGNSGWKKRHIEQQKRDVITDTTRAIVTTNFDLSAITTTTTLSSSSSSTSTLITSSTPTNGFHFINNNEISNEFNHNLTTSNNSNNNNNNSNNNNNNNNTNNNNDNNNNANDVTLNLINSSTFINDLFEYDAGYVPIVPIAITSSSNLITNLENIATTTNRLIPAAPTFATITDATNDATNAYNEANDNWQSTDLLELDHRYNSGLQTEFSQLASTLNMKPHASEMQSKNSPIKAINLNKITNNVTQQQQPQQQQHGKIHFLISQKQQQQQHQQQITTISDNNDNTNVHLTKYRSIQNLTNLGEHSAQKAEIDHDFEDKNLSWLLNFKFDELPHLSPDVNMGQNANINTSISPGNGKSKSITNNSNAILNSTTVQHDRSRSPKQSMTKTGKKFEELVMEVTAEMDANEMIVAENVIVEDTSLKSSIKKPPFTYTELIEYALEDKGELTVSGIYQWISDRFPYYKSNDDRWKNSVRHNLSINPHFRKGVKAPQGAGHLWTISSGDSAENVLAWEHKKQRLELFFKMESMNRERLQQHHQQQLQQQHLQNTHCPSPHNHQGCQDGQCLYEEAATAAVKISEEMQQPPAKSNANDEHLQGLTNTQIIHELPFNDLISDEELRKTAGQILNGIHREVEVQSVNSIISTYHDVVLHEDYLNPIQKEVAVHESGLRHTAHHTLASQSHHHNPSQFYVTEIDPLELGIQMSHQTEEEVLFSDDFNLNYFGYNAGNDIVA